jgi:hypothetical protein
LPAGIAGQNQPADLADLPVCPSTQESPPMSDAATKLAERPANLMVLQLQLLDLAARSKPVPQDRPQDARGPVLVIRGK